MYGLILTYNFFQVFWRLVGPLDEAEPDFDPMSGSARIQADRSEGEIILDLLADSEPELDESFTLLITKIEGGAEIESTYNTSSFTVRY